MKTKEELFKIYSAYLPYELRLQYENGDNVNLVGVNTKGLQIESEYTHYGYVDIRIEDIKPILYSMDYLTKEIDHKGERFIPIYKLKNSLSHRYLWRNIIINREIIDVNKITHDSLIMLLEWHFNVFNLSDSEYIKKETLNK